MWARKRFDLSWLDIGYGLLQCLRIGGSVEPYYVNQSWKDSRHPFTCLSVRTGFDLLLSALNLPKNSEIIVSALTIEGMLKIIEAHGLVAVPVDIETDTLAPSVEQIESVITDKTKLILIAHLFGSRINLDTIAQVAQKHQLLLIEDCAQQFDGMPEGRQDVADVSMYSFGPIKTATALGGAVFSVAQKKLADQLTGLESKYPKRPRSFFFRRLLKYSFLKFISYKLTFAMFVGIMKLMGKDYNELLKVSTRGFSGPEFFKLIRRRPSSPLVVLLARKLRRFNGKSITIQRELGEYLKTILHNQSGHQVAGSNAPSNHYWVFPTLVSDPAGVELHLRAAGIDANRGGSMVVVQPPEGHTCSYPDNAEYILANSVFLPVYKPMTKQTMDTFAATVAAGDVAADLTSTRADACVHSVPESLAQDT